MTFWSNLETRLHDRDQPPPDCWRRCYESKYAIAQLLRPASILEFGVRAGYSAFAFLSACPQARYVGIDNNSDTHGGFSGAIEHAKSILTGFDVTILEQSSSDYLQSILAGGDNHLPEQSGRWPEFELVHVDGDHSMQGCLEDLHAAVHFRPRAILVDDYFGIPEVHEACDRFATEQFTKFTQLNIQDGHNGATLFIPISPSVARHSVS